ncbi:MAG: hypothetical protein L3J30_15590 [Marinosulfonomonas sp.]|nr:hypothetical protein [Marinosulfonomonas sp.]
MTKTGGRKRTQKRPYTRRSAILAGLSLPLVGGLVSASIPALAAAPMLGTQTTRFNRFKPGSFEVTALLAGTRTFPDVHSIFGTNISDEEFARVSADANLPADKAQFFFTPTVVNTGSELVLFYSAIDTYMLESDGQQSVLIVDSANHYVWSLAYPDWEVRFNMDKAAAATRRQIFGMLSADKLPFIGYHMPWPASGYVEARDDGFQYAPASYQLMME